MIILQTVLLIITVVIAIPVLVLFMQVLASLFWSKRQDSIQATNSHHSIAIIIPAHNESTGIVATIQSILPQLKSQDRLIVVADNCTDDTEKVARDSGAIVVVRENKELRGKSYALDFGLQSLKNNPPQIVIIIDADCTVSENAIPALANACDFYQRPIQALYLMSSLSNSSLKTKIAQFAWVVKNQVRPLGFKVLGLPCQLMGTGMAFLWNDLAHTQLASGHIAEDMKLGIDLCRVNKAPLFFPQVLVSSFFPTAQDAEKSQRARWEHGHLGIILSDAPALFIEAVKTKNLQMLGMAFDLIVPPLAALALICCFLFLTVLTIQQIIPINIVLISASLVLIALVIAVLVAWFFFGRSIISFKQLCYAPIYALIKIPLYLKFFVNRQVEWVRTKRD
ncbi:MULTISPECIES: glycosyltransferase family 2 protein [Methylotenera]|uniref:glycosyltransferase family 2 protein n=1 Tax=Methylotenera TaxID=359407 RepID=UPI000370A6B0|nr:MULTISPECIES: glycosyltransferase family 2 protein [Methylotenera]